MIGLRKYMVRGTQGDLKFEHVIEADDPWSAVARVYRYFDEPSEVTSIAVIPERLASQG